MSVATIEKNIHKLPQKELTGLLARTILGLSKRDKTSLFHLIHVKEIVDTDEKLAADACPLCHPHKEPNAKMRKSLEETEKWIELKRAHEKLKTRASKEKLEAYEKEIGIVHCKDLDDFSQWLKEAVKE